MEVARMEEQGNTNENEKNHEDGKVEVLDAEQEGKDTADEQLKLQEENEALKKEKDEVFQRMLRVQAEFDNFKKRSQREKEADRKYKSQDLVNELLPAVDNFERALQVETTEDNAGFVEGITMVYRQIKEALKSQGVEEIDSVDKEFDPNLHHAVMQVEEEDKEPNIIVEELQKGYVLKDRVIRPAMVKVNK
jgi:molecular chaperone GrpE